MECEDHVAVCAYCSTPFPRSKLTRDGAGLLRCSRHTFTDRVTCAEENAAGAEEEIAPADQDGGEYPKPTFTVTPISDVIGDVTF
jgi:hypothetical protein